MRIIYKIIEYVLTFIITIGGLTLGIINLMKGNDIKGLFLIFAGLVYLFLLIELIIREVKQKKWEA